MADESRDVLAAMDDELYENIVFYTPTPERVAEFKRIRKLHAENFAIHALNMNDPDMLDDAAMMLEEIEREEVERG